MPKIVHEYWFGHRLKLVKYEPGEDEWDKEGRTYDTNAEDFWILRGCAQRIYLNCETAKDDRFTELINMWMPIDVSRICDIFNIEDDMIRRLCEQTFTLAMRIVRRDPKATVRILDELFHYPGLQSCDVFAMCTPFKASWKTLFAEGVTSELLETIRKEHFSDDDDDDADL